MVDLGEQILTEIDIEMDQNLREILERKLVKRLHQVFFDAYYSTMDKERRTDRHKEAYDRVKPILDDCLDRVLGQRHEK